MKVIISGGGTGGHIFPAVAIAKTLQKQMPGTEILFVGAEGKMEMEKVPAAGYKIIGLPIVGIQRRITWKNLLVPMKVISSLMKARKIIREFRPDIAIGVGGYASGPLLRSAVYFGVKSLIQEQNSYPGITNKLLAKKVNTICVAYDGLEKYFPKEKIVVTGNPVRPEVVELDGKRQNALEHFQLDSNKKTLLIIGGSLGARTINHAVHKWAETWTGEGIQVLWQTGKHYFETAKDFCAGKKSIVVRDFIREMDLAYAVADLIISRAGAMSISELCLVKKPVVFVPSPNVSEDHQTKNAMALVKRDAAVLVTDANAVDELGPVITKLASDESQIKKLSSNISSMAMPGAAEKIVAEVLKLVKL